MKIKIKKKDIEVEIEYKTSWWGSEYHHTEMFRMLPFLSKLLGLGKFSFERLKK